MSWAFVTNTKSGPPKPSAGTTPRDYAREVHMVEIAEEMLKEDMPYAAVAVLSCLPKRVGRPRWLLGKSLSHAGRVSEALDVFITCWRGGYCEDLNALVNAAIDEDRISDLETLSAETCARSLGGKETVLRGRVAEIKGDKGTAEREYRAAIEQHVPEGYDSLARLLWRTSEDNSEEIQKLFGHAWEMGFEGALDGLGDAIIDESPNDAAYFYGKAFDHGFLSAVVMLAEALRLSGFDVDGDRIEREFITKRIIEPDDYGESEVPEVPHRPGAGGVPPSPKDHVDEARIVEIAAWLRGDGYPQSARAFIDSIPLHELRSRWERAEILYDCGELDLAVEEFRGCWIDGFYDDTGSLFAAYEESDQLSRLDELQTIGPASLDIDRVLLRGYKAEVLGDHDEARRCFGEALAKGRASAAVSLGRMLAGPYDDHSAEAYELFAYAWSRGNFKGLWGMADLIVEDNPTTACAMYELVIMAGYSGAVAGYSHAQQVLDSGIDYEMIDKDLYRLGIVADPPDNAPAETSSDRRTKERTGKTSTQETRS